MASKRTNEKSKGQRTAARILDAAESLFSDRGYDGASLRQIALQVGIHEPGIYNHFKSKEALYGAVLDRALTPMMEAMQRSMNGSGGLETYSSLPGIMTDHLAAHPQMASLFHQALQSDATSVAGRLVQSWLGRLLSEGMATMDAVAGPNLDRHELALRLIAMFNLTTGYFLSQRAFAILVPDDDDLTAASNIARQKRLLMRVVASLMTD